ncbi:hypothetical protein [Pseudomonas sp. A-B-26]|uniref:hypothetical protein n=1 Tax=Pseudomonas sp. A-B-26 TaxID=2832406 RepID=UPI001CC16770|nr:hypothetical protein [Pseudomonas sp. A-B-26]
MSEAPPKLVHVNSTVEIDEVHDRTAQEVIIITSDKLELELEFHIRSLAASKQWQSPLSLLIGVVVIFCTSNFKDAFGLKAEVWSAVFFVAGIIFMFLFVRSLFELKSARTVKDFIKLIKNKQQ